MSVEVEVIDAPLDYNLLLGRNWTYVMSTIALAIFCVVFFHMRASWLLLTNLILLKKAI